MNTQPEEWEKDIPKYKNGSTTIPKDEIVIQYSVFKREIRKDQFIEIAAFCENKACIKYLLLTLVD